MTMRLLAIGIAAGLWSAAMPVDRAEAQEGGLVYYGILVEEFEYRRGDEGENAAAWDGYAYFGPDEYTIRLLSEGEYDLDASKFETLENQVVGQIPISDFFDAKAGIRLDTPRGPDRWYGVLGINGLAPQWFEVDGSFFLSDRGDLSARFDVEYKLLLTSRLTLAPSARLDLAFSDDTGIEIKSGLTSIELGLRLSYDVIGRTFSPYIGVNFESRLGDTRDLAASEGGDRAVLSGVVGAKFIF